MKKSPICFEDSVNKNRTLDIEQIDLSKYQIVSVYEDNDEFIYYNIVEMMPSLMIKLSKSNDIIDVKKMIKEANILKSFDSQFIIKCKGINLAGIDYKQSPTIIMEYVSDIKLSDIIYKDNQKEKTVELTELQKLKIIYGIATGMSHVHSKGIIHRNLTPDDIFLDEYLLPKICNFELSIILNEKDNKSNEDKEFENVFIPRLKHFAPEILREDEYDQSVDVYAFGVILYDLISKELFKIRVRDIIRGKIPPINNDIPKFYADLISKCLSFEPKQRPTFDEIISIIKTNQNILTKSKDKKEFSQFIRSNEIKQKMKSDSHIDQIDLNEFIISRNLSFYDKVEYFKVDHKRSKLKLIAKTAESPTKDVLKIKKMIKEANILKSFDSQFIIKCKGINLAGIDYKQSPTIIMEYVSDIKLSDIIYKDNQKEKTVELTELQKLKIIYGIATGMSHVHSKGIIHRKLAPKNIFLDEYLLPKICNFESSIILNEKEEVEEEEEKEYIITVNPRYFAPEILREDEYDQSVDVYAFGVILYDLISKELFKIRVRDILRGKIPPINNDIPKFYADLISKCLSFEPKQRPTFDEIISIIKTNQNILTKSKDKKEFSQFIHSIENHDDYLCFNLEKVHIEYQEAAELSVDIEPIDLNLYEKREFIGKGQFGKVFKVREKATDKIYAAKINLRLLADCQYIFIDNLSREINILSKLNNPSILKFIGYSQNNFSNKEKPTIITEFSENSSLEDIIELQNRGLSPKEWNDTKILIAIYGIASGMAYLHSKNIIHRDLKPANIFFNEYLFPKIGDFGLSKELGDDLSFESSNCVGTPAFMSPEIFDSFTYSKAGDVYAFAILLYQMITLNKPFKGLTFLQLVRAVHSGIRPEFDFNVPNCYQKLIRKCWLDDAEKRPTFDEIVNILENDEEFIRDEIDANEYFNFINYINNNKNNQSFNQILIDFDELKKIQESDPSLNVSYLDLKKFIKQKLIRRIDNFKVYEIKNKETNVTYEAKISTTSIVELTSKDLIHLSREINILSKFNHPSFLKFIGYSPIDFNNQPKPTIITEIPPNKSLKKLLEMERDDEHTEEWDDTKKLINIYGIASGMAYLHSHNVIHRNLSPESIFLDEFLFPKIGNFGLLSKIHSTETMTFQTSVGIKGNIFYSSPELLEFNEYSKSSDVYAYSLIVYEIMTHEKPFKNIHNFNTLFNEVVTKSNRPKFDVDIDEHYRKLIELCWSQNINERPSFSNIVSLLKNDPGFITESINKEVFFNYIHLIEKSNIEFYSNNLVVKFDDLIKEKNSDKGIERKEKESISTHPTDTAKVGESKIEVISKNTIKNDLNNEEDFQQYINKEFNDFKKVDQNDLLLHFIQQKADNGDIKCQEFLAKKYTIQNDTENIYKYLNMLIKSGYCRIPLEYAIQLYDLKHYKQAFNYFTLISETNNPIALFFLGVMQYQGKGCEKNQHKAYHIIKKLSDSGIDRASAFLKDYFE